LGPHRPGKIPYVPAHELMMYERLEEEDGQLIPASRILVYARQPLETSDVGYAERVQQNLKNEIRYRYFFHADLDARSMIAQLIWTLGTVGFDGETIAEKRSKIDANPSGVLKNLQA